MLLTFPSRSSRLASRREVIIHRIMFQGIKNRNIISQLTAMGMSGVCAIKIVGGVVDAL